MSTAEGLHQLTFTGRHHQTVTGAAEKGEEVTGLNVDQGELNQGEEGPLHLGAPHIAGHQGPGEVDLELQVVTGVATELLKNCVKSEESNKLKGLCHLFCPTLVLGQTIQNPHILPLPIFLPPFSKFRMHFKLL